MQYSTIIKDLEGSRSQLRVSAKAILLSICLFHNKLVVGFWHPSKELPFVRSSTLSSPDSHVGLHIRALKFDPCIYLLLISPEEVLFAFCKRRSLVAVCHVLWLVNVEREETCTYTQIPLISLWSGFNCCKPLGEPLLAENQHINQLMNLIYLAWFSHTALEDVSCGWNARALIKILMFFLLYRFHLINAKPTLPLQHLWLFVWLNS